MHIVSAAMVTCLGADLQTSCAAARAGLVRRVPSEFEVFDLEAGDVASIEKCSVPAVSCGFTGLGRLVLLGRYAARDLLSESRRRSDARTALLLNLSSDYFLDAAQVEPDTRDDIGQFFPSAENFQRRNLIESSLAASIADELGSFAEVRFFFEDHAGVAAALNCAVELFDADAVDRCVVGGIDCLHEVDSLSALKELGLLRTAENLAGILPGEAAAFLLVERTGVEKGAVGVESISSVTSPKHFFSESSDRAPARALADVICAVSEGKSIGHMVGTLNNLPASAAEWGFAQTLVPQTVRDAAMFVPSVSFGDTGAASGFLSVCLAMTAMERGYARPNALIWSSSPFGAKSAVLLGE